MTAALRRHRVETPELDADVPEAPLAVDAPVHAAMAGARWLRGQTEGGYCWVPLHADGSVPSWFEALAAASGISDWTPTPDTYPPED